MYCNFVNTLFSSWTTIVHDGSRYWLHQGTWRNIGSCCWCCVFFLLLLPLLVLLLLVKTKPLERGSLTHLSLFFFRCYSSANRPSIHWDHTLFRALVLLKKSPWLLGTILDGSPLRRRIPSRWHSICQSRKDDRQNQPQLVLIQQLSGIWTQDPRIQSPNTLTNH